MNSRIVELLKSVGLAHRIILPRPSAAAGLTREAINWGEGDRDIAAMRAKSVEFLDREIG